MIFPHIAVRTPILPTRDLNYRSRSAGYEPDELPGCSTPRIDTTRLAALLQLRRSGINQRYIALVSLVDVPVIPGDGIKRGLADGLPRSVVAILFATITNVIAYLPFLMLAGSARQFLRSLSMDE